MVKILFLHPNLGIEGSEHLVLDAAVAFKKKGHDVTFYTNNHDPTHRFAKTRDCDFPVKMIGGWIPRSIFGRFKAACAHAHMVYSAVYIAWYVIPVVKPTLIFCDSISLCIPFLKMAKGAFRVLYYCPHPEKLSEDGILKRIYRVPLNWLQELTTAGADKVLVNSNYTACLYQNTFQKIKAVPEICYPAVNPEFFRGVVPKPLNQIVSIDTDKIFFLSINRCERKEDLQLALRAFDCLRNFVSEADWNFVYLIMAGCYDPTNLENLKYWIELGELAAVLDIDDKVIFFDSPTDVEMVTLLYHCRALIYTPSNASFDIVHLHAMYCSKPIIAVNSGSPTETVVDYGTGILCKPKRQAFAFAMRKLLFGSQLCVVLGEAGRMRFDSVFSFEAFSDQLDDILRRERQIILEARALEY